MRIALVVDIRSEYHEADAKQRLPTLERCLARCDSIETASHGMQGCLLGDFGIMPDDAPLAALSLAGEGGDPGSNYWLRADPICLQPTLHRLAGRSMKADELDWHEARARAAVIAPHLYTDGCELRVEHPVRWYLRCPPQRIRTRPLPTALIPLDEALMPAGPDAGYWQRTMTEAQMLFHSADLDGAREASGRASVNGIWCWGGGSIDTPPSQTYTDVISDDVLALGLARLSGAVTAPLPDDAHAMIAELRDAPERRLLIAISADRDLPLATLESKWLAPLASLVGDGLADRLDLRLLLGSRGIGRRITRKSLRRWWRRTRPFIAHA